MGDSVTIKSTGKVEVVTKVGRTRCSQYNSHCKEVVNKVRTAGTEELTFAQYGKGWVPLSEYTLSARSVFLDSLHGKKAKCEKCISLAQKRYAFNEMAERLKESFGMTPVGAYEFFPPETLLGPIDGDKRSAMQRQVEHYQERFSAPNKRSCDDVKDDEAKKIKCEAARVAAKSGTCIGIMRSLSSAIDVFKAFKQTFRSLGQSANQMTLKKVFHPCSGDFKTDGRCKHDEVMPGVSQLSENFCGMARRGNMGDSAIFKVK